jgi:hypothetical protein
LKGLCLFGTQQTLLKKDLFQARDGSVRSQMAECADGLYSDFLVLMVEKGFHGSAQLLIGREGNQV